MFNRENIKVRPLSEELESIGLDPDRVMGDIERNSGMLEEHAGSPPTSEAVRPQLLSEETDVDDDGDIEGIDFDDDAIVEWDGGEIGDDEELQFLGEKVVRVKAGYRVDPKSGKLKKVKKSELRKEKTKRMKKRGKLRTAAKMYRKRFKTKIKKRQKRIKRSGKQKKGFRVRVEGTVGDQLQQLREDLEQSDVNTGEVTPYEEAAINAGWLARLLGECFEAMGDVEAGEMLYRMSDSAADLSESIEAVNGELDEDLEAKLTSLLEGVTKALATHEEIGSPSLFESIEMGVQNGLYEDEEDDDDDYIDEDDDGDTDGDDIDTDDDEIDFDDDE